MKTMVFSLNFHLKGKYVFFSRLDVVKGYYQVPVINASREKTAVLLLLGPTLWGLRFCFCLPGRYLTSLRTKESTVHICESFKRRQRTGLAINSSRVWASSLPASLDSLVTPLTAIMASALRPCTLRGFENIQPLAPRKIFPGYWDC